MRKTFEDGALLVNLIQGDSDDRMTAGRCYRVVNSYDGHSGCGAQEWVRVADNRGMVVGFDPDRFILADPDRVANRVARTTATRMLRRLLKIIKGVSKEGVFATLHSSLKDQIEDAQSIIAATAEDPIADQIVFDQDENSGFNKPVWRIVCNSLVLGSLSARSGEGDEGKLPIYDLTFDAQTRRLEARGFDDAFDEVRQILTDDRLGRDFTAWALGKWMNQMDREGTPA